MDKSEAIKIAQKYLAKIKNNFKIKEALLFGSFIKGTNNEFSDIDIALVLEDFPDLFDTQVELMKLRRDIDLRIEPHPFRFKDFIPENPIVYEIKNTGINLIN